jgi:serpin B
VTRLRHPILIAALAGTVLVLCACGASGARSSASVRARIPALTPDPAGPGAGAAVAATDRLALALLPKLGDGANLVLSPYSVQTALAMVDQGAAGQTAIQIGQLLGNTDAATLATSNRALLVQLSGAAGSGTRAAAGSGTRAAAGSGTSTAGAGKPTLDDANSLWLQSGLALKAAFSQSLAANFGVAPQLTDFEHAADAARAAINAWVADRTQQLIQNLMGPDAITPQTALVLANAIYLKARWQDPFNPADTRPQRFFPDQGPAISAPFMTHDAVSLRYARGLGYQAIELPYRDSTLAMLAIMPSAGTIARFEGDLSVAKLAQIVGSLSPMLVNLAMPRLSLSVHSDLGSVLSALGMPLAFTNAADFSGIAARPPLKIQAVEHAAVLKLDEAGTVAAAATGISIEPTAAPSPIDQISVTLDHPFLLFLRDTSTGAILFDGRVSNPLAG